MIFMLLMLGTVGLVVDSPAQPLEDTPHPSRSLECATCHECDIPTRTNPCLLSCPRQHMITLQDTSPAGPPTIVIDQMSEPPGLYTPVTFSHRLHAEMATMAGGCTLCHHYNPPGRIVACSDCHDRHRNRADITKPDLKGAYHRQCMGCHRTWDGASLECASCHALNEQRASIPTGDRAPVQATGRPHPVVARPTRLLYETAYDEGDVVTFHHDQHVDLYAFQCADCHQNETCADCHSGNPRSTSRPTSTAHHELCSACHVVDDGCEFCHRDRPRSPFDHNARAGFDLTVYHQGLACTECHGAGGGFAGLSAACTSCHDHWTPESFEHAVTGVLLDDEHVQADCVDCHRRRDFRSPPTCEECHDDDVTFPARVPAKSVATPRPSQHPRIP